MQHLTDAELFTDSNSWDYSSAGEIEIEDDIEIDMSQSSELVLTQ